MSATIAGGTILRVEAPEPRLAPQRLVERLTGEVVEAAEAVGKHHLLRLASGRVLHSHLGMVGSWRVLPADRDLMRGGLWLALWTETHVAVQYRGPRLRLYEAGHPIPGLASLGPDLLDPEVDPGIAMRDGLRRGDPTHVISEALLDQRLVAGIGNIVRSEALFLCGVHPFTTTAAITDELATEVGRTAQQLLADGVAAGGRLAPYRSANPRSRERTWVYGRPGRPCRRCGTPIAVHRTGAANRAVFWCPTCQPPAQSHRAGSAVEGADRRAHALRNGER